LKNLFLIHPDEAKKKKELRAQQRSQLAVIISSNS
jgi:hypothetical protein